MTKEHFRNGIQAALILISITDGFTKFETVTQLCRCVGITLTIRAAGSSVKRRSGIGNVGNRTLRDLLFLYAFSTGKFNKTCSEVYKRMMKKESVKNKVDYNVHQTIKISYWKSGLAYDEHCASKLV